MESNLMEVVLTTFKQFSSNDLFRGGFLLMVFGSVAHYCREIPRELWKRVVAQFSIDLTIFDRDEAFRWLSVWLIKHPYTKRSRLLTCFTHQEESYLVPAPGWHWFFYRKRLVFFKHTQDKLSNKSGGDSLRDTYYMTVFTRNRTLIADVLKEAKEAYYSRKDDGCITFKTNSYGEWDEERIPKRSKDTVTFEVDDLLKDANHFFANPEYYRRRGIPHRRGYLFYGPPGNGKSTVAHVLASELNLPIGVISLNRGISDDYFRNLVQSLKKGILLLEDVDCLCAKRKMQSDKLSFSGLLNGLDGVGAGEGRLLIMTTNHRSKLDPALIRPGRVDKQVLFPNCTIKSAQKMFERFYPEHCNKDFHVSGVCHAAVQGHLMQYGAKDAIAKQTELK